jgi:heptosyltransferase-2/heptosyltransferase-3
MALPGWKKILVVDLGFLGDTVHSVPALRALAATGAEVDVMTTPVGAEVLSMVPELHRIWITPLRKPSPPWWQGAAQLCQIRAQQYDAALSWIGSDRNLYGVGWSGARERVGRITGKNPWPARLRLTRSIDGSDRTQPVFEQRLSFLRDLGWSGADPGWVLAISAAARDQARRLSPTPFIHLSVNAASTPLNEWPLDEWAGFLRRIWKEAPQLQVLATAAGSEREGARLGDLAALVKDPRLRTHQERALVPLLAGILEAAELHVGLDSGVLHLAVALGKPTVSLFRESVGRPGWAPRGSGHRVLVRDCPCNSTGRAGCAGGRALCLSQITPEEVAQAVLALLPGRGKN